MTRSDEVKPESAPRSAVFGAVLLALVALVALRIRAVDPPSRNVTARATESLTDLARAPRPPGTPEHTRVRDAIVAQLEKLGFAAEIQRATAVSTRWGVPYDAARVENVVARLKGRTPGKKSLALLAHYDSVPNGPGAADDASGVVALLETANALAENPPRNDVVLVFSDAEEAGVLGTRAFVSEHKLFQDIGLALNFDARGNRGPVVLVETSAGGGALVRHFGDAAPSPVASSLLPEVSRLLGHETDLGPFLRQGVRGMNFAFADGVAHYHAPTDDARRLDPKSLAHAAGHAVALARRFGEIDLDTLAPSEVVYFDVPALGLVVYGRAWALPLAITGALAFTLVLAAAIRRRRVKPSHVAFALLGSLVPLVAAPLFAAGLVAALRAASPVFGAFRADPYEPSAARIALALLGLATFFASQRFFRARLSSEALSLGVLLLVTLLALASAALLPGASHVFTFPLFAALAVHAAPLRRDPDAAPSPQEALALVLASLPAIVLAAPVPYLFFIALGLPRAAPAVALVVLVAHLLSTMLERAAAFRARTIAPLAAAGCFLALAFGFTTNRFSTEKPRPACLAYALDHDAKRAVWLSTDARPAPFVAEHVRGDDKASPRFGLPGQGEARHEAEAPLVDLEKPALELLSDETSGDKRCLRFRLRSRRAAPFLLVSVTSEALVLGATIDGKRIEEPSPFHTTAEDPWGFTFQAAPESGIEWSIDLSKNAPVSVRVVDRTYDLPENLLHAPWPSDLSPIPFRVAHSTFVAATFTH